MTWADAGVAWGARAPDWAALIDPWTMPVYLDVFDRLGVGKGERVLDIACGSGLSAVELRRRGAVPSGLDASAELIDIATERSPGCDFRVGDLFELPWGSGEFDVVTSFNGIWGLDRAMAEARRVLRPGGRFGISFFGSFDRIDLMKSWVIALLECSPPPSPPSSADDSADDLLAISQPGAAEEMCRKAGLSPVSRGATSCAQEFPDVATAVRAYSALGPAYAAINHVGEERWSSRLHELFSPFQTPAGVVRLVNESGWVTAAG
jgi:SAM-dependent methyltransferase